MTQSALSNRAAVHLLGVRLDLVSMADCLAAVDEAIRARRPLVHASLNAAKLVMCQEDETLRVAVRSADLATADGQSVVWAARLLGGRVPERVAGIDLMHQVVALAAERGYQVYLLGATDEVLAAAARQLRNSYPNLRIAGIRNGYWHEADEESVLAEIRAAEADILFVALGTPQKELFLARHRSYLEVPFAMGVGGALDVLAGVRRRAPRWAQRIGAEWLVRLAQEPRRLMRRYLVGNARFVLLVARRLRQGPLHVVEVGNSGHLPESVGMPPRRPR